MKKIKILAIICALVMATNVHAALQSRPGVEAKNGVYANEFFKGIRDMEATGGVLNLNAKFTENASTGEYEEISISNSIDVHMCKNTEWGAAAMLSASDYGIGNGNMKYDYNGATKIYGVGASTTGNMTGIFALGWSAEYVAAGIKNKMQDRYAKYLLNASARYVDTYEEGDSQDDYTRYIPGDATYETLTFFDGYKRFTNNSNPIFGRGSGNPFQFAAGYGFYQYTVVPTMTANPNSRACMWVGDGI